ncbi:hypothetical protein AZE42_10759 [Rhizopogon vesiculosus]|uniref:Uncharacterized protein n=1 Tax=Rhizopogon vesiculosus TaxID=180088 RepID=A0A1J8Q3U9_9AGAM|nr:hypothetical protein AZE42_10759 [Rhizopogon vesiculosus]
MSPLQVPSGRSSGEDEKHSHGIAVAIEDVDTGAALIAGTSSDLDPVEVARVRYVLFACFHPRLTMAR